MIILTPKKICKCSCRHHKGSDGLDYWVNIRTKVVYYTDCHKENPKIVKGLTFQLKGEIFKT